MKTALFLVSILFCMPGRAQKQGQAMLDSLIASIPVPKNDTLQIRLLNSIIVQGVKINPGANLEQYAGMGLKLAQKMKWDRAIAVFHTDYGDLYSNKEKRNEAIHEYELALDIQQKIRDSFNICISQNNIGVVHQHNGNYTIALQYFTRTVNLAEAFKNTYLLALGYANIATVYTDQGDYDKALRYLQKSLSLREKDGDVESIASAAKDIADVYVKKKDSALAVQYYTRALNTFLQTENKEGLGQLYGSLAALSEDSLQKKVGLLLKAQNVWDSASPGHPNALANMGVLGETFLQLAQKSPNIQIVTGNSSVSGKNAFLQTGLFYVKKGIALSKEASGINNYAALNHVLSSLEEEQGNYKMALAHFKIFYVVTDSIYSQENKNKIASIESQKTIDLKDNEIAVNEMLLYTQRKTQWYLVAAICLLVIIGGLLYWQNRTRKKTNAILSQLNNDLDEANKVKARFFAIFSHDFRGPVSRLVHFLHLQKEATGVWTKEELAIHEQKLTESAESLLENMETTLTWSKGQMENFKPVMRTVQVSDLFDYLETFFANTENIKLLFMNPGELQVVTDEYYLKTIMHNLTANSIKALKGIPGARIRWNAIEKQGKIILSVTDNGPGISAEQLQILGDLSAGVNIKEGLGFYLVRDLTKAIKCEISWQSNAQEGTSFYLSI